MFLVSWELRNPPRAVQTWTCPSDHTEPRKCPQLEQQGGLLIQDNATHWKCLGLNDHHWGTCMRCMRNGNPLMLYGQGFSGIEKLAQALDKLCPKGSVLQCTHSWAGFSRGNNLELLQSTLIHSVVYFLLNQWWRHENSNCFWDLSPARVLCCNKEKFLVRKDLHVQKCAHTHTHTHVPMPHNLLTEANDIKMIRNYVQKHLQKRKLYSVRAHFLQGVRLMA